MKNLKLALLLLVSSASLAATTTLKQIDNIQNSTGGSSLAVPSTGTTLTTDTNTQTLTNKTVSGSSNTLSNIPVSAISTGTGLSVQSGGTGDTTLTSHGVLIGNGTGAVSATAAGTAGQVLTSNGASSDPTYQSVTSSAPTINASQASPQSVTAGGGISLTAPTYQNVVFVVSNSGSVTVTATPSITACTAAGQLLRIVGESGTNKITLQDQAGLASSGLALNGNWTSGLNSTLTLMCDGNSLWVEMARQQ